MIRIVLTENYHRNSKDVVVAVVAVPIIDVRTVRGIEVTNVGDVGSNVLAEYFPSTLKLTAA